MPSNVGLSYDVENRAGGGWFDLGNRPLYKNGQWYLYGLHGERLGTFTVAVSSQIMTVYGHPYMFITATPTQTSRNIYFAGRLIQSNGKTVVRDQVGSVRANEDGETFEYYPYGEEITLHNPQDREKFGTYTRDSATGLDDANQRLYGSVHGRFNTPDFSGANWDVTNPGSWNTYGYVNGDPGNANDPEGLATCGSATLEGGPGTLKSAFSANDDFGILAKTIFGEASRDPGDIGALDEFAVAAVVADRFLFVNGYFSLSLLMATDPQSKTMPVTAWGTANGTIAGIVQNNQFAAWSGTTLNAQASLDKALNSPLTSDDCAVLLHIWTATKYFTSQLAKHVLQLDPSGQYVLTSFNSNPNANHVPPPQVGLVSITGTANSYYGVPVTSVTIQPTPIVIIRAPRHGVSGPRRPR